MTQTGYKTIWQNKMETNVSLDQKLDFITKGLTFSGTFASTHGTDNTITRSKSPELSECAELPRRLRQAHSSNASRTYNP